MSVEQKVSLQGEEFEPDIIEPDKSKTTTFRFVHSKGLADCYLPVKVSCDYFTKWGRIEYEFTDQVEQIKKKVDIKLNIPNAPFSLIISSDDGKRLGTVTWTNILEMGTSYGLRPAFEVKRK